MAKLDRLGLCRFAYTPDGVFGSMTVDGAVLYTVERPWLDNQAMVSCIPEGAYKCRPRRYFRGGYGAVHIRDVPGRTHILFHRANVPSDLAGCIGVGSKLGVLNGQWAVLQSRAAFARFMDVWGRVPFELSIAGHGLDVLVHA